MQRLFGRLQGIRESLQRDRAILVGVREKQILQSSGVHQDGLPGYAKKLTGGVAPIRISCSVPFMNSNHLFGEIGNAFNLNSPGTALATRGKCVAGDPRAGRPADAASRVEAAFL